MTLCRIGRSLRATCVAFVACAGFAAHAAFVKEYKSGIDWPEPRVVEPGENGRPPSDAIVLFDGTDLSQWQGGERWEIREGEAVATGGGIETKESFGDVQLHIEWAAPAEVRGKGQGRGNSGVFLMGRYEVQILDSYENPTYYDGQAGSIYKQHPPLVNASRKPGEWQTYDILFTAPRFGDDGSVQQPAYVTVLHNGVVVQNHFEIQGATAWHRPPAYEPHPTEGPIQLQFHGNPVRFRNIWVRAIEPLIPKGETERPAEAERPSE